MKHIVTTISALLFIGGTLLLDNFLFEGNSDVSVLLEQHAYEPASAHAYNTKTGSLPLEKCQTEKEVEGAHVKNGRFTNVRKISLYRNYVDPFLSSGRQAVMSLPSRFKVQPVGIFYIDNNLPLHIRNCIWLI